MIWGTWCLVVAIVVFGSLIVETAISARNERRLRQRGAVEPKGDVYRAMRLAYPLSFGAMLAEGVLRGGEPTWGVMPGVVLFVFAKVVKYWAIATLGERWSFRVLVVPAVPLVTRGPYRVMNHPNYVGVVGELAGTALMMGAWVAGALSLSVFLPLLARRVTIEEAAIRPR